MEQAAEAQIARPLYSTVKTMDLNGKPLESVNREITWSDLKL